MHQVPLTPAQTEEVARKVAKDLGYSPEKTEEYVTGVVARSKEPRAELLKRLEVYPTPSPPTIAPAPLTEEPQWRLVGAAGTGVVEAPPPTLEQLKAEAGLVETAQAEVQSRVAQLQGYLEWRPAPDVKTLGQYLEEGMRDAPPELHEAYRKKHEEYTRFYEEEYKPAYERYRGGYGRYESAYGAFTHVQESMAAAEAGVMRGLVTAAFEGEAPPWARIWEPAKPLDASRIQAGFLGFAIPSQEMIARQHLKNLVSSIMGVPITEKEKAEHIRKGIIKPSDIWQPPPKMVPAEAEKYFVGMPPKWYLGEAPTPGELQLQKAMEKVGESLAYSGTVWYGVKESLVGKIPLLGEIAVGYVKAADPWAKALAEVIVSLKEGGPLLTGKVPILHEGPVFTMGLDPTIAGQLGYVPGGFPVPKQPGLLSLETLGGAVFYAGLFKGATMTAQLGVKSATYGFQAGARGMGVFTKPLRAVAHKAGPAFEAELVYTEFQLAKASASVKGAVRGIFTTEPFYYYPRVGPAGQPTLTPMYKALDAMKQRLGMPKLPTIVSRAGRPGELAHYRLGGLVKYEYAKPAPSITSYWDVPIKKFGGVPPLPSELVWVRDSARITTQLNIILEKSGLREVQAWYKIVPTGKAKPILYQEYLQSLRKAVGQTVSATRLSGFEAAIGKKAGTGYYWSLERLGVTPAEKAVGWFGIKTRGKIFPEAVSRAGVPEFVFDEQLIKLAAAFKKDKAVIGFITEKAGTQVSAVAGGVRSHMEKLMDVVSFGRFRVGVSGGATPVGDGVLGGYGQFARAGQQLLLAQEPALEAAWGPWLFPESSQLGLTAAGLGVGVGTAIGARAEAATSAISGLKAGTSLAAGVRQVPRMGQTPFFELAPFQAQVSGVGVAQAQSVAQAQKSALAQMQVQMQQTTKTAFAPLVFPYGMELKVPPHRQKVITARFRPYERIWPVGEIERLFEVKARRIRDVFKVPEYRAPKMPKIRLPEFEDPFKLPKKRGRRRR